jgi:hypothetical protein
MQDSLQISEDGYVFHTLPVHPHTGVHEGFVLLPLLFHRGKPRIDGFVKSPTSALRCILRHCSVPYVRLIPQDLRALNLKLFTLPSNFDFLRVHQEFHLSVL